jgi:hypothetical protein
MDNSQHTSLRLLEDLPHLPTVDDIEFYHNQTKSNQQSFLTAIKQP